MEQLPEYMNGTGDDRQMKILQMYQKLVCFILLKFKYSILAVFLVTLVAGMAVRYLSFKLSPYKYEGTVTLFYTPRASEEVKPLSINQVLAICSRQQIFQQTARDLQLSAKQLSALQNAIEVAPIRDRYDMFTITARGDSDEYVKKLVNTYAAIAESNYEEYRLAELRNYLDNRTARLTELRAALDKYVKKLQSMFQNFEISHPREELETVKKVQTELQASIEEMKLKLATARKRFEFAKKKNEAIPAAVIQHRIALHDYSMEILKRKREYEEIRLKFSELNPRHTESRDNYTNIVKEFEAFKQKHDITDFDPAMLVGLNDLLNERNAAEVDLNLLELSMKSLKAEEAMVQAKEKKLQEMMPEYDQIQVLLNTTQKETALLLEELNRVRSAIDHVPHDITGNERLLYTQEYPVFPRESVFLILAGAVLFCGMYAAAIVLFQILYGKFSGIEEASTLHELIDTLGVFPAKDLSLTQEERDTINHKTFYNLILHLKATRVLFSCCLDGSFLSSTMFDEQCTKARRNTILVRLITESEAEKRCAGLEKIGDFYYYDNGRGGPNFIDLDVKNDIEYLAGFASRTGSGYGYGYGYAFFPVRRLSVLEPDEISRLYHTINELKQHYQLIRIAREKPFAVAETMLRQLFDISEGMLIYIGRGQTSRKLIRQVINLQDGNHPLYAIVTGETNIKNVISGDYNR